MLDKITKDKIKEQVDLEKAAKADARLKALERSERSIKTKKGSQSNSGIQVISKTIPELVKAMAEDLMQGVKPQSFCEPAFYTFMLEPGVLDYVRLEDMANIGLAHILDAVGSGDKFVNITGLQKDIGDAIEDQARFVMAQQANPRFVEYLADRYFSKVMTRKRKAELARLELDVHDDPRLAWTKWDIEIVMGIGSWVVWLITRALPWFEVVLLTPSGSKYEQRFLILSKDGIESRTTIETEAAKRAHARPPMLIPPSPWVEVVNNENGKVTYEGGYLTESSYSNGNTGRVIHGPKALIRSRPSETAIEFLNKVQDQPWKVNQYILDILEKLSEQNLEIGSFVSYVKNQFHIPRIPQEIKDLPDDDPIKREARKQLWLALERQTEMRNKHVHPQQAIQLAREWKDREVFWIPWFFDSRLRAYPLVTKLSPQGTDFQKALLLFADGAEVTLENWDKTWEVYMIAIATTYGNKVDKASFNERIRWADEYVRENLEVILANETGEQSMAIWTAAEEPFQHLALLKEYNDIFIQQTETISRVPIGYDATCSGLQLLGSFVRDETTCNLVNVLPAKNGRDSPPNDAYGAVAEQARFVLSNPDQWKQIKGMAEVEEHKIPVEKIDRKVAKKVVMLIPYGGSYPTLRGHVRDATKDWGLDNQQINWLTKALIYGMQLAVPGFSALNSWFRSAAKEAMDAGLETVTWHTFTGSTITQHYRDPLTKQVHTFLINKARVFTEQRKSRRHKDESVEQVIYLDHDERQDNPRVAYGWGDVLKRKNETALAANWTHSQDAAVLQSAFHDFELPFTTVHDCLYCPAPIIPAAVQAIREAFVRVVTWDAIDDFINTNSLVVAKPEYGTADVTKATESDYLFS
jgi:DNA-directed RNA polymerase